MRNASHPATTVTFVDPPVPDAVVRPGGAADLMAPRAIAVRHEPRRLSSAPSAAALHDVQLPRRPRR